MMISYPVLVRRNHLGKVSSLYFPDLCYEHQLSDEEGEPLNLQITLNQILLEHLNFLKRQGTSISRPKKLKDYKNMATNSNAIWTKAHVDFDFNEGFFEKILPRFGLFSSMMTALTMALISFSAIEGSTDSGIGIGIGIFGAICSSLMAFAIYYYSNAGNISMKLGKKIDEEAKKLVSGEFFSENYQHILSLNRHSTAAVLGKLLITTVPITSVTVSSIAHYQQVKAMGDRINDDKIITKDLFYIINTIMIFFSFYSLLTFQISFLPSIYQTVERIIDRFKNHEHTALDENEMEAEQHREFPPPDSSPEGEAIQEELQNSTHLASTRNIPYPS